MNQSVRSVPNNFDGVRMLAALMVLVNHQFLLLGRDEIRLPGGYSLGDLGVAVFFAVSGFLVSRSWQDDPHLLRFFAKRFLRIWPALCVVVLLTTLLLGPLLASADLRSYFADPRFARFFKNLVLIAHTDLPVSFAPGPFEHIANGSLWTIPLEVRCYVLLALAGAATLLRRSWCMALLMLALAAYFAGWLASGSFLIRGDAQGRSLQLDFIACFFAGAAWNHWRKVLERPAARRLVALAAIGLATLALLAGRPGLALWLGVPCLTLAIGMASWPGLRSAGRWGDISYGMYLYAFPVQQTVHWALHDQAPLPIQLVLSLATTVALALASWHGIEKHALRHKPRRA